MPVAGASGKALPLWMDFSLFLGLNTVGFVGREGHAVRGRLPVSVLVTSYLRGPVGACV